MCIRLAFAVATEIDPDILLVDELLDVGEEPFQNKCFRRLQQFRESGKTIVLISHSTRHILENCEQAVLLDRGKLMYLGAPHKAVELYERRASRVIWFFFGCRFKAAMHSDEHEQEQNLPVFQCS